MSHKKDPDKDSINEGAFFWHLYNKVAAEAGCRV